MFRRESSTSGGAGADTDLTPQSGTSGTVTPIVGRDKRSASIAGPAATVFDEELMMARSHHMQQFPVTASHRRNNRRASMLEMGG